MTLDVTAIQGACDERFASVREIFAERIASGEDFGGSLCVIEDGQTVVDLWGGRANPEGTAAWQADTIVNCWSITKTMSALCALLLIDRGQIDPEAPVARYWPAFAAGGKDGVLVRHVLSHASGLPGWDGPIDMLDICNTPASTERLAAQAPWWEPGTASGYHLLSYGHLIGGIVRAVTGKSLSAFFRDELAEPLGADFHIGLRPRHHHRIADIIPSPPPPMPPEGSIALRAFMSPIPMAHIVNSLAWRCAEVGGANGHGNARAIARIQSILSHAGTVDGQVFLKPETIARALTEEQNGIDLVIGQPIAFGLGYSLGEAGHVPFIPKRKIGFWSGAGGALVINDTERRTTFAYAMNRMEDGAMIGNANSIAYYSAFEAAQSARHTA